MPKGGAYLDYASRFPRTAAIKCYYPLQFWNETMSWREVLDIDRSHELKGRTWWWWWFIFFFRNQARPDRTKQMVILWGTRNCGRLVINDIPWVNDGSFVRDSSSIDAKGVAAGWYYDGENMHDPLFVDGGDLETRWTDEGGTLSVKSDSTYALDATARPYRILVSRPDARIDLTLDRLTAHLDPIVPTGKDYLGHLGYRMHKIRGSRVTGTVAVAGKKESVEGTAYFQKVRINSPTSPWYWGVFQSENGSYIDYFMPHIGMPMFRRDERHSSGFDWGERMLSKGFQFIDGGDGKIYKLKGIRMSKRYENDLPIFLLQGERGDQRLKMEMTAYARAYWKIVQPFLGLFTTKLYYNEYPVNVTEFEYSEGAQKWSLPDLGRVVGNCEHAWGLV